MTDRYFQFFSMVKVSFPPKRVIYYIPEVSLHLLNSCSIFQMSQGLQQDILEFRKLFL